MSGDLVLRVNPLELAVEVDVDDLGGTPRHGAEYMKTLGGVAERGRENGRRHGEREVAKADEEHLASDFKSCALFEHDCGTGNRGHTQTLPTGGTEPVASVRFALNIGLTHIRISQFANDLAVAA